MKFDFIYEPRIELEMPVIHIPMEDWEAAEVAEFYDKAQSITAKIPAKILEFDKLYMRKYEELQARPDDFFEIMDDLNELSGKISELNVLYLRIEGSFLHAGGHF